MLIVIKYAGKKGVVCELYMKPVSLRRKAGGSVSAERVGWAL